MSIRLLNAYYKHNEIIHTALDDLESFLWLLIWGIVHSCKGIKGAKSFNPGVELMLDALSGKTDIRTKFSTAVFGWQDAVFGGLIRKWLNIFIRTHEENVQYTKRMSRAKLDDSEWTRICDDFELYLQGIYREVLESGFKHLYDVRQHSDWDKVVAAWVSYEEE